jgi:nucleoside-diphosphate-sugar epimerase
MSRLLEDTSDILIKENGHAGTTEEGGDCYRRVARYRRRGRRTSVKDGFSVVINYAGDAASAEVLAHKIEQAGGYALTAQADVSDPTAVRRMFDAAETAFGSVDVLVNNAGIMPLSRIADADDAHFDRIVAVNLKGTFNALREAAKRLRKGGRIINFSTSVVGTKLETYGGLRRDQGGRRDANRGFR